MVPHRLTAVLIAAFFLAGGAASAAAASIEPFLGHWAGAGITEDQGPGSDYGFADRNLDVTIVRAKDGFRITWQTLVRDPADKTGKSHLDTKTVTFVATERDGFYRMAPAWNPMSGDSFLWAQVLEGKLILHSIAISEKGVLEYQKYTRILVSDNQIQLFYTRSVDGSIVRSVLAQLFRK